MAAAKKIGGGMAAAASSWRRQWRRRKYNHGGNGENAMAYQRRKSMLCNGIYQQPKLSWRAKAAWRRAYQSA